MRDGKIIDAEFEVISGPQPEKRKTDPILIMWLIKMAVLSLAILGVVVSSCQPQRRQPYRQGEFQEYGRQPLRPEQGGLASAGYL